MSEKRCDETCSCPLREACIGRRFPEFGPSMRAHWDSGDPVRRRLVISRSGKSYFPPDPELSKPGAPPPTPRDEPTLRNWSTPAPLVVEGKSVANIPLAGDLVASLTAAVGVDRLTKWTAKQFGTDCGCADRQRRLNELDRKARRLVARLARREAPG